MGTLPRLSPGLRFGVKQVTGARQGDVMPTLRGERGDSRHYLRGIPAPCGARRAELPPALAGVSHMAPLLVGAGTFLLY